MTCAPTLPPGIYVQIYRHAIRGPSTEARRTVLARYLDQLARIGLPGVVLHGFPEELAKAWDSLAPLAQSRGLLALASWGLDIERMNSGRPFTGSEKGTLLGDVLARPSCAGGLLDAEGAWDSSRGADDVTDEGDAMDLVAALRGRAPAALVGDQPWFAIDWHGEVRKTPRPLGQGGVFAGFPVDEFAAVTNMGRFPQAYCNNFTRQYGPRRYERIWAWMERDWAKVEAALEPAGLLRPRSATIQGYGWDDIPWWLVHCLLAYRDRALIVWSEPFPTAPTLRCIRAAIELQRRGFAPPGVDPREAVRAFQRAAGEKDDGLCGNDTMRALGV